ncbi:hypothetical protein HYH03_006849 [Edaphochlamys debaryana]|uniref:EGF-like domain-containing protein n=1 Tax=Edaphochlamys debaryana TaxID=47281 RepID=A0A835YCC4_9CHLO|nr:hypothetical protein HYH03_006849 [Edaphochlamys debaryana]|eukprot:KAG2494914.1 hypothetical protein HYH03_006849 [Edaphochlamys debaryana]
MRPLAGLGRMLLALGLAAALLSMPSAATRSLLAKPKVFLSKSLPLTVVVTTPVQLATGAASEPVWLSGRDTLTAVFSRPVIALGSDFAVPASQQKLAFTLDCPVPGKARWVTTSITRLDPDEDWPTDLDCEFKWNTGLTSYDGAPLKLGDMQLKRRLASGSLFMSIGAVTSERASALTDDLWLSNPWISGQSDWEVPPDGKIQLGFNYTVNVALLKDALKVNEGKGSSGKAVAFEVTPCQSPLPGTTLTLDINTTCAVVVPSGIEGDTRYNVRLPKGSRYHALAGPLGQEQVADFVGLRPFSIMFNADNMGRDAWSGTEYRRLDLGLVHGLSDDTPITAFAAKVSLCEVVNGGCTPTPITVTAVAKGVARVSAPALKPGTQYRIAVAADAAVKDGFGQPLQASSLTFWTKWVDFAFSQPRGDDSNVLAFEPDAAPSSWPIVTRGPPPPNPQNGYADYVRARKIESWIIDLSDDTTKIRIARLVQGWDSSKSYGSLFGAPASTLEVPADYQKTGDGSPSDWAELALPLPGTATQRLVVATYTSSYSTSYESRLLLTSTLSVSVVAGGGQLTAWVTDSRPGVGPVAGATVTFLYTPNSGPLLFKSDWQPAPKIFGSCVTDAQGVCSLSSVPPNDGTTWTSLTAIAVSEGQATVLRSAGMVQPPTPPSAYVASLVADRLVVVPGDSLVVTAFVQAASPKGLALPPASWAVLRVSPGWSSGADGSTTSGGKTPGRGLVEGELLPIAAEASVPGAIGAGTAGFAGEAGAVPGAAGEAVAVSAAGGMGETMGALLAAHVRGLKQETVAGIAPMVDVSSSASSAVSAGFAGSADGAVGRMPMNPPSSDAPPHDIWVNVDGATGSIHAPINVPASAKLQKYSVTLLLPPAGAAPADGPQPEAADKFDVASGAALAFTVADPRPPTAELLLTVPPWVLPTGSVTIRVALVSYIGAAVDASRVKLNWRHTNASGYVYVTSDVSGMASTTVDLGALPAINQTKAYDTLFVDAEWIGPTRERITAAKTVTIADGPAKVTLERSLATSLPGTAFSVSATLVSNVDGQPLRRLPVAVTLKPHASGAACATTASCSVRSGDPFSAACQLALPCVGHFELEACATVPGTGGATEQVCGRSAVLGKNATEWTAAPLMADDQPFLTADEPSYAAGDVATLTFQNPYPSARVLLLWGNDYGLRSQALPAGPGVPQGLVSLSVGPLGPECLGGCTVTAVLDAPRAPPSALPLPPADQLRVSKLYDPRGPRSHAMSLQLSVVAANSLAVEAKVAAAGGSSIKDVDGTTVLAVEPGTETQITVSVDGVSKPVEVTLYAVDKAFLDLLPYDLPEPEKDMVLKLAADMQAYGLDSYRVAPGAVRALYDKLIARLTALDPWLPTDTLVTPTTVYYWPVVGGKTEMYSTCSRAVDTDDADYLARFYTPITYGNMYGYGPDCSGGGGGPIFAGPMESAADASFDNSGGGKTAGRGQGAKTSTTTAAEGTTAVRDATAFKVTPLAESQMTGADGKATFLFKAPEKLGTYVIRAFAADGPAAKYGSAQTKLAVKRQLSLTPSVPRFVRVTDSFEAGVVVTVGSAPAAVSVTIQIAQPNDAPLTLTGLLTKTVSFTAGGGLQKEVRFSLNAIEMGVASLTFSAAFVSSGGGSVPAGDALELELAVHGQQADVWVATSFALAATPPSADADEVQWQEGLALPDAVPRSGGLTLTAGVGHYPAIAAVYDALLKTEPDRIEPVAHPAMLWATLPALLSDYAQTASIEQATAIWGGFEDLVTLTSNVWGLQWTSPSRFGWTPNRADIGLNTWALFLANQHGSAALTGPSATAWAKLDSEQLPDWRAAVVQQIIADAVLSRSAPYKEPYSDFSTLAWVHLTLPSDWLSSSKASAQIKGDLSLDSLFAAAPKQNRQTRVLIALVALKTGSEPALVTAVANEVTSALRTQGRTTYVAAGPGSASASPYEDQSLCLLLLLRAGATHQLVPKLAAYVANPVPAASYGIFSYMPSYYGQGLAAAVLSEYDKTRGSSKPDVDLKADVNGRVALEGSFRVGGNLSPISNTTAWEDIPPPPAGSPSELNFQVTGSGEVSVAAALRFVPSALLAFPSYRGLYVEAALQMVDPLSGGPTGRRVTAVPLASVVALTVQLTTPDDLAAVTLSVMMPAGLEPLDPNLQTGVSSGCGAGAVEPSVWGSFYRWWWWPVCPAQETRPSVVTFNWMRLSAGTSSVTVYAVAASVGKFVVPPIRAWADDQPELMGMTAGSSVTVCADCAGPAYGTPPAPPLPCPGDCSGHGTCNLKTGRCRCDGGWSRSDCSRPVA